MKFYNKFLFIGALLFAASCSTDYDTEEYFDLEELPGYVAFFADGNSVNVADVEVAEGDAASVVVHCPTGVESDITVNYSLGGDAEYGVDYTIDGASASGGSVVISAERGNFGETFRASIDVTTLTDEVVDGTKTITLTLTSASSADGELAVGRGGKDFQKNANVIIADVDM